MDLPDKQYDVIYADPPWSYRDKMDIRGLSLDDQYQTQSSTWIKNLPVGRISGTDCVLFLWVVSPQLDVGLEVMQSWGFTYKTVAYCWSKTTKTGKKVANLGRWTMGNVELCLLGVKGKPNKWRKDKTIRQLVEAERTVHSKKPDDVRHRIVQLLGERPRIELFARDKVDGWDSWGNEAASSPLMRK